MLTVRIMGTPSIPATNFQFGGDPKRLNIPVKSNMWVVVTLVCCCVSFFFVPLSSSSASSNELCFSQTAKREPQHFERERERDAKRSHKNENENSIRQIKHKPKCPRELIILFYFVKSVLFLANRENEPNVYNCKTWRSFAAAAPPPPPLLLLLRQHTASALESV